ncbi:MAG: DUF4450 domain-containing protein, partial [Opitutus sp.]
MGMYVSHRSWRVARFLLGVACAGTGTAPLVAQIPAAAKITPNRVDNIDRPLRYRPEGKDFVIANGTEFFNRPLYGGNTAFRVDAGDRPEFSLYLPGRGGNLRLGLRNGRSIKWLHEADTIVARYRAGEMIYEVRDPLMGDGGVMVLNVVALPQTEGLMVRASCQGVAASLDLVWAYGGINGQRGRRDGDIGTESVPISEYFQLRPEYCRDNIVELINGGFILRSSAATIVGVATGGAHFAAADARNWNSIETLFASSSFATTSDFPIVTGSASLSSNTPSYLLLQRVSDHAVVAEELETYRAVTKDRAGLNASPVPVSLPPAFTVESLPGVFAAAVAHFAALRSRVEIDTPDAYINAASAALNVAADAVWDGPQQSLMHGAIAWRSRLLGWRGAYALDAL